MVTDYRNLLKTIPKKDLERMSEDELWENFYCPRCKVKLKLTLDEPPLRICPKCGAIG